MAVLAALGLGVTFIIAGCTIAALCAAGHSERAMEEHQERPAALGQLLQS